MPRSRSVEIRSLFLCSWSNLRIALMMGHVMISSSSWLSWTINAVRSGGSISPLLTCSQRSAACSAMIFSARRCTTTMPAPLQVSRFCGSGIPPTSSAPADGSCAALYASISSWYFFTAAWCFSQVACAASHFFLRAFTSFSLRSEPSAFLVGTPSPSYSEYLSASLPSWKSFAGSTRPLGSLGSFGSLPVCFASFGTTPSQICASFLDRVMSLATTSPSTLWKHWAVSVLLTFATVLSLRALLSTGTVTT
mmetsp:Transcript_96901/g.250671  ORF Transcript_96901/g.250671 Transcript_96901/m.250671 type:complete len:251 (-) Transcript_96901:944-1696(-)